MAANGIAARVHEFIDMPKESIPGEEIMGTATTPARPPFPPFTRDSAMQKVRLAEDAWNTRDPYLRALENFSQGIGLIPEQIWDGPDLPNYYLRFGGTTDAAMPLLWAHSEYVKLHRSAVDGRVFDLVEAAYERYVKGIGERKTMKVWKPNRQVQTVPAGTLLRIQANAPFLLHWTSEVRGLRRCLLRIPVPVQPSPCSPQPFRTRQKIVGRTGTRTASGASGTADFTRGISHARIC
jgi:hypothetical protein